MGEKLYYEIRELILLWRFGEHKFCGSLAVAVLNDFKMLMASSSCVSYQDA
jgi:hypothetical protein